MVFAFFSVSTFAVIVRSKGGENTAPQRKLKAGAPHHTGAISFSRRALGAEEGFLDAAGKTVNGTTLLPLSPCPFTLLPDKIRMNTFSRKDTCVIV